MSSVPSWTLACSGQRHCCSPHWPMLCACRGWWPCGAWVFITVLYTSLVPSHSSQGACYFDAVPASCPASGLHMEGWASDPVPCHVPSAASPKLLVIPTSSRFCIPMRGLGVRAWQHLQGTCTPASQPDLKGKEQGWCSLGYSESCKSHGH